MTTVDVRYQPSTNVSHESFDINPFKLDSIICELKRKIFKSRGILPIHQRLSLEGSTDNFSIPTTVVCTIRSNRNPNATITISGFNQDSYRFAVDTNTDNILDIKFLLSQCIKEHPEYIQLIINNNKIPDHIVIKGIDITCGNHGESNHLNRFWLEYPSKQPGHGAIHRTLPTLTDIDPNFPTIAHTLRKICQQQPNDPHLGTRSFLSNGERGEYQWMTFKQLNDRVSNLAAGFRYLGLAARTRLGICAVNRVEWVIADYAAHTQSFISVPLYDTLGKNAIEYIVHHASVEIVVCTKETFGEIRKVSNACDTLKYIIICDDLWHDKQWVANNGKHGWHYTMSELEHIGSQHPIDDVLPEPDDIASICYTSGTTGTPKGAMLTHRCFMSGVNSWWIRAPDKYIKGNDDAILSYLPLAHNYERSIELFALRVGARIGYYSGSTDTLLDDIQALKPALFVGVPRVFQKIQDTILREVSKSNFISRFLFNHAYSAKQNALQHDIEPSQFWEQVVMSKVKAKFGGKLRACISGSAPLSRTTAQFMKICLSDMVGEGYGLTETSSTGTTTDIEMGVFGHVGTVTPSVEMKLVDVVDMNYLITDKPYPRGEIWIRGTSVFKGYYRNTSKTNQVLSSDGWFATGDVGMWMDNGRLMIIDRKKNIFKLAQGEYIRPEYIENVYKISPLVENIFVYGDSNTTYLVAVVVPEFEMINEWAKHNGLSDICTDNKALCRNGKIINMIRMDMERVAVEQQLVGFEKVKRFVLHDEEFNVSNGILTSTMKLKRHFAKKYFKKYIDKLYEQVADSKL